MCESLSHPNHYRCAENAELRRARQNRHYALRTNRAEPSGLADNPVTDLSEEITAEDVSAAVKRAREVLQRAENTPSDVMPGAYMPGERLVISNAERDGWEYATEAGIEMEQAVRDAGAAIAARAEVLAQERLVEIGQSEQMRALRPEGFASAQEYADHLDSEFEQVRTSWRREQARFHEMLAQGRDQALDEQREVARAIQVRGQELEVEKGRTSRGENAYQMAEAQVRAQAYREALAEQRSMGAGGQMIDVDPSSSKAAVQRLQTALEYYPTDWIEAEKGYVTKWTTSGIMEADHEGVIPLLVRDAKTRTRTTMMGGKEKYFERAFYSHATVVKKTEIDRNSEERRDVAASARLPKNARVLREYWETKLGKKWVEIDYTEGEDTAYSVQEGWLRQRKEIAVKGMKVEKKVISAELVIDGYREGCVDPGVSTALHEYGHRAERINPRVNDLMHTFIARRTTDPSTGLRDPLTHYAPSKGRPGWNNPPQDAYEFSNRHHEMNKTAEFVRSDGFVTHYMGKQTTSPGSSEMFTTGMEALFAGRMGGLVGNGGFRADHEHRDLILGTLASVGYREGTESN